MAAKIYPVIWQDNKVKLIDQTLLPQQFNIVEIIPVFVV